MVGENVDKDMEAEYYKRGMEDVTYQEVLQSYVRDVVRLIRGFGRRDDVAELKETMGEIAYLVYRLSKCGEKGANCTHIIGEKYPYLIDLERQAGELIRDESFDFRRCWCQAVLRKYVPQ